MNAIVAFGNNRIDVSNKVSDYIIEHIYDFINPVTLNIISRHAFITKIRNAFPKLMSNTFDGETYKRIYTGYKGKIEAIKRKLVIKEKQVRDILYYKRTTVVNERDSNGNLVEVTKKPGDVREIRYRYVETQKTKTLSYLAKYGNDNTLDFIKEQLKKEDVPEDKKNMYKSFLEMFDEYGFDVLLKEALEHRQKVFNEYLVSCTFESATFFVDSRITETFIYNKKKSSKIKAFIKLVLPYTDNKGVQHKYMLIPIKINDKYHGDLTRFNTTLSNNHIYLTISQTRYKNVVNIFVGEIRDISHRTPTDEDIYAGFDVNTNGCKINGTGNIHISHEGDDEIISKIAELNKELKEGQKKEKKNAKKENRDYNPLNALSKKKRNTLKRLSEVMKEHNKQDAFKAVVAAKKNGTNHIVMENLTGNFSKSKAKDTENNQNFNDKTSAMQLSSIKNYVQSICQKKNMSFSLVQPEYTSQRCPKCGCIHKANRKTQEKFVCVECGYEFNADDNATDNIIHRVASKKLCDELLKKSDDGFVPKSNISKDMVLDTLLKSDCCSDLPDYSYLKANKGDNKLCDKTST